MNNLSMSLKEIPKNASVALYGTGKRGQDYFKILSACRPDVTIACFIDSFKEDLEASPVVRRVDTISLMTLSQISY